MAVPAGPPPPQTEIPEAQPEELPAAPPQELPSPPAELPSPPQELPASPAELPSPLQELPAPLTPPGMLGGEFPFGWKPSVPQAMWDPDLDESRRPDGLTPENEAWLAHQRALRDAGKKDGEDWSVPPTIHDSPQDAVVAVSDEEIAPRNLSPDLEAASCPSGLGSVIFGLMVKNCLKGKV